MTTNPIMISDNNKFDTEIIKASHGKVIGKVVPKEYSVYVR